jgi:two-component system NtrC family sensor kinase
MDLKKARDENIDWSTTLEKKVEEKSKELKMAQAQIIKIEKMASLGKLSATVAHELNNPLAGMLNYTKLIMKRFSNKEISKESIDKSLTDLNIISSEIQRLGNIVKNLLLFSKKKESDFVSEKFSNIINSSIDLVKHHLEVNNIRLEKNFDLKEDIIFCYAQQIKQALIALFINAVEAMVSGGTLRIDLRYISEKELYDLQISDTGIGIDQEDLQFIFEPFYTTKTDEKGVGLGLSVVYGIMERHNGSIEVISEKNKGTTFFLKLPKNENTKNIT